MAEDNKALKPKSFRIDDDTAEKFKQIAITLGGNQQETLAKLIEAFEFQQGKAILTDKKADIETFECYVTALTRMYMSSLEDGQNTKELVRSEFDALLKSKDAVIQDLQEKLSIAKQMQEQAIDNANNLKEDNITLNNQVETLQTQYETDTNNLKSMLDDKDKLNKALTDSCSDLKSKVDALKEEHRKFEKMAKEFEEVNLKVMNLDRDKEMLETKIEEIKQHEKEALQHAEQEYQIKTEKALLDMERKYQEEIQLIKSDKQKEIDKYQQKYFELLETQGSKTSKTATSKAASKSATK